MNILMINGTGRKESTYHVGRLLIDRIAGEGDQVIELFLPKDMPEFCRGCGTCLKDSETKCIDYLMYTKRITRLMDMADLLVFTTPVYVLRASGAMKALLDHYGYRFMVHRPEESMFRKQAVCIATAAGGGMRAAIRDMKTSLFFWGVAKIHSYGTAVGAVSWAEVSEEKKAKIQQDIRQVAEKITKDTASVQPGLKTKLLFCVMRYVHKNKSRNPADTRYWEEKGWLGKKRPWGMDRGDGA